MQRCTPRLFAAWLMLAVCLPLACAPAAPSASAPSAAPTGAASPAPAATAASVAPTPAPAVPVAAAPATVRVGVLSSIGDAPFTIGLEQGYYAEQGLDLELISFDSAARMVAPFSAGQLDVGQGVISAGVLNAIARGVDIKAVAGAASSPPGHGNIAYLLRGDLVGVIRTPADLKGRKIGTSALGSTVEVELVELLKRGGLALEDVEIVQLNFAEQAAALGNRAIDLASIPEPAATLAVDRGYGQVWLRSDELIPDHLTAVIWYSPRFAAQTDVAQRFMVAALRAVRVYNDAFFKNDPRAREAAIPIFIKHTPVKDRDLYDRMVFQGYDPNGWVNRASIEGDQRYYVATGQQSAEVDLDRVLDPRFVEHALRQLGPYQP